MGDRALGAGAFGAGLAKSLAGAFADKRERERQDKRRSEDRAYDVEKLKFQTMLPSLLENIDDVDDEVLAGEFPTIFGGRNKQTLPKFRGGMKSALQTYQAGAQAGSPGSQGLFNEGGASTSTMAPMQPVTPPATTPAPTPAGNGKVVFTDLDTQKVIGEAAAQPRRTVMGVPVLSHEEKTDRAMGQLETETSAKVALARRMLPQLKAVDPSATIDDALAVVGIRTPSSTARSAAAMRPQSVRGTINGEPAFGIFDPTTRSYIDPDTQQPLKGFRPLTPVDTQTFGVDREAIAQSVFGKRFGQLNPQERTIVLREEKTNLQQESSARALGSGQGRFEAPIDIETAQKTGAPVGTSAAQVAGQAAPTMQQQERRRSVEQLKSGLEDIRDRLIVALPKSTELQGLAPGAAYAVRRRLPQYRNQIASLESAINNVVNVMARSVGEQRGTQTERDAMRAEAAIASLQDALLTGDTQESAKARITESLAVLERILGQLPQPLQPVGTPGGVQTPTPGQTVAPVGGVQTPTNQPPAQTAPARRFVKDAAGNWVLP